MTENARGRHLSLEDCQNSQNDNLLKWPWMSAVPHSQTIIKHLLSVDHSWDDYRASEANDHRHREGHKIN